MTYRIQIGGSLDPRWSDRLGGLAITSTGQAGKTTTILEGELLDQGALLGVLNALYELHLPLEAVETLSPDPLNLSRKGTPIAEGRAAMEIDLKTALGIFAHVTLFLLMLTIGLKEEGNSVAVETSIPVDPLPDRVLSVGAAGGHAVGALVPMGQAARLGMGTIAIIPGAPMLNRELVTENRQSRPWRGAFG